jgi:hypothetical protein
VKILHQNSALVNKEAHSGHRHGQASPVQSATHPNEERFCSYTPSILTTPQINIFRMVAGILIISSIIFKLAVNGGGERR